MPITETVAAAKRVDQIETALGAGRVLHVRTRFLVYRRGPDDLPEFIEERPDLELLYDPSDGFRALRGAPGVDVEAFDEFARTSARLIDVPITCHEAQYEAIADDDSKVIGIFGGNRAGKTECIAWWIFRKWMIQGGDGRRFWWISPNWKQTRIGVQKLCKARNKEPPIIPPELRVKYPINENASDQAIIMIDGSRIELHHANGDGDNLKGYNIEAAVFDEITAVGRVENWRIGASRTMDAGGQVAAASTPKQGHWARDEIVTRARFSSDFRHLELTCFDNPWVRSKEIDRLIEANGGPDDPVVRREFFGEWIPDGNILWGEWKPDEHTRIGDIWSPSEIGLQDITAQVARGFWGSEVGFPQYVAGQDFNVDPMTTVVCKVFGDPNDPGTWGTLAVDVVQTRGNVAMHADRLARKYPGVPIACDPTGALPGTHPSHGATGSTTNALILRGAGFPTKPCGQKRGKPWSPRQVDSINLTNRLFRQGRNLVCARCRPLIQALDTQEATPKGGVAKESGTAADRLSAPTDALRYLHWALFSKRELNRASLQ